MVLRSPFVDLAAVAAEHFPFLPVQLLLRDRFPVLESVADIRVPTLVIYGTADTVVPPEQSRAVADGAGGPVEILAVPGADHNDRILLDGPEMIAAVTCARRTRHLPTGELTGCRPNLAVGKDLRNFVAPSRETTYFRRYTRKEVVPR